MRAKFAAAVKAVLRIIKSSERRRRRCQQYIVTKPQAGMASGKDLMCRRWVEPAIHCMARQKEVIYRPVPDND